MSYEKKQRKKARWNGYKWTWMIGYPGILIFELLVFLFAPKTIIELQKWEFWVIILVIPIFTGLLMMFLGSESTKGLELKDMVRFIFDFILSSGLGFVSVFFVGNLLINLLDYSWFDPFSIFRLFIGATLGSSVMYLAFIYGWARGRNTVNKVMGQIGSIFALVIVYFVMNIVISVIF